MEHMSSFGANASDQKCAVKRGVLRNAVAAVDL